MNGPFRSLFVRAYAGALALSFASANAQTCPAPMAMLWMFNQFSAQTCGGEAAGLSLCNGLLFTNAPAFVATVQVGESATAELSLGGVDALPMIMVLVGPSCDEGGCVIGDPTTPISLAKVPPGEYDLLVTTSPADGAPDACGPFTLTYIGDFGVFDRIFADGLD